jgi:hypothetical protein
MDDGHGFDLSFSQARLWVIDRLAPGEPLYNLRCAVRLRQAVDAAALQSAVNAVVERHEALRTVFREHDGRPVQIVLPAMTVPRSRSTRARCYGPCWSGSAPPTTRS